MRRCGKKGMEWSKARAKLKIAFEAAEITSCEIRGPGCTGGLFLGFAHTKKRRNIVSGELYEVVLACVVCHNLYETLGERIMSEKLEEVIAARVEQPQIKGLQAAAH